MNSYAEALSQSIEYFANDELAAKVFVDKYALRDNDQNLLETTPTQMHWRLAHEFARIEKKKFKTPYSAETLFGLFDRFKYIVPQGSPMFGIGNNHQIVSLSNCYVTESPYDSYGGILKVDQEMAQISKRRGGVGTDISNIRPAGAVAHNAARTSTGIVPFLRRYSNTIREVGQAGRRGALMVTISVHHPEVMTFATIKNDDTEVTGANISIRLTDEFLTAVQNNTNYELRWPVDSKSPIISNQINARSVWNTIVHSAWLRAEPGLLFWDNIVNNNAVDCYAKFGFKTISTNPCSELPLCAYDSCRLLVLNLYSYVGDPFSDTPFFDWALFHSHVEIAQRLMDDMIDLELEKVGQIITKIKSDPEPTTVKAAELLLWEQIKEKCELGRRTGTGVTAVGDMLAALNIKYGSPTSVAFIKSVFLHMKLASFRSSVDMAKEIGAFPIWDWSLEKDSAFLLQIKQEDPALYASMAKYGRRNIANLTIAPTGSLSLQTQTTSGIEPLFKLEPYIRKKKVNPNDKAARVDSIDQQGDSWQHFEVYHPKVKTWMAVTGETDINKSPWAGCCAEDIDWVARVQLQATAQEHIDHAISSTLNLPEDVTEDKVAAIYEAAWKAGCKGITVYRKNCRTGVMVDKDLGKKVVVKPSADGYIKRPKTLKAEVYHYKVKTNDYFVIIGLDVTNEPYEVFAGKNGFLPRSVSDGYVEKIKRGCYRLLTKDETVIDSISEHCEEDEEALTRLVSTSLRHKVGIEYVVTQLGKVKGNMTCLAKAISRALKKHVKDGTCCKGVTCSCGGSNVVFENGCNICKDCGNSKCH